MSLLDPAGLLAGWGAWAVAGMMLVVFVESGVLFPFLPGDSLLFTAGMMQPLLGVPLPVLIGAVAVAAILGDQAGYALGSRFGRRLFREDARLLSTRRLEGAEAFFARHGGPALVLARFTPMVRTYVPLVAGMARLKYATFLRWNVLGGLLWATVLVVAGSLLGHIPLVADHVDLIALGIVALSLEPIGIHAWRAVRARGVSEGVRS